MLGRAPVHSRPLDVDVALVVAGVVAVAVVVVAAVAVAELWHLLRPLSLWEMFG